MRHLKSVSRTLPAKAEGQVCKTIPVTVEGGTIVQFLEMLGYTVQPDGLLGVTELCKNDPML